MELYCHEYSDQPDININNLKVFLRRQTRCANYAETREVGYS